MTCKWSVGLHLCLVAGGDKGTQGRGSTGRATGPGAAKGCKGAAEGELYLDEGDGYGYRDAAAYHLRRFSYSAGTLASTATHAGQSWRPTNTLERVEVLGAAEPKRVSMTHNGATTELTFHMDDDRNRLVIRKPDVPMADDWQVTLH